LANGRWPSDDEKALLSAPVSAPTTYKFLRPCVGRSGFCRDTVIGFSFPAGFPNQMEPGASRATQLSTDPITLKLLSRRI
jgi:hypothetical protein